jgi:hypothetical protein
MVVPLLICPPVLVMLCYFKILGKKIALCVTKKINIITLVLSENKFLNETKNHNTPHWESEYFFRKKTISPLIVSQFAFLYVRMFLGYCLRFVGVMFNSANQLQLFFCSIVTNGTAL